MSMCVHKTKHNFFNQEKQWSCYLHKCLYKQNYEDVEIKELAVGDEGRKVPFTLHNHKCYNLRHIFYIFADVVKERLSLIRSSKKLQINKMVVTDTYRYERKCLPNIHFQAA